MSEDCKDTWKN